MNLPWGIIISILFVIILVIGKEIYWDSIEEKHVMQMVLASFLVVFVAMAALVGWFTPEIPGNDVHLASVTQFFQLSTDAY